MKITAYKAFGEGLICRGMQYEIGQTYTYDGPVKLCESGFHACELAMDVWAYYPLGSPVAVVELDATSETCDDSKRVGASITIKEQIDIEAVVEASVAWITARTETTSSGDGSHLASSGYGSRLASSGYGSRLASSGNYNSLASSGYGSSLASSGYGSTASAGPNSAFALAWHDGKRPRFTVGYVGEDGIEPNVAYRCDVNGKLVRA